MEKNRKVTPVGAKNWFNIIVFGLVGQVAWVVENMYFATFAQKIFADTEKFGDYYYIATTAMVIFSALTATVTTIFAGALSDKKGKRKPFITAGYIFWGVTIMLFAAIPVDIDSDKAVGIIVLLTVSDCIMTFAGSTANDAAFSAWTADISDVTNRGLINTVVSTLPVFATVITIVAAMFTFDQNKFAPFFIILGAIPLFMGFLSLVTLKDVPDIKKSTESGAKEIFYGFRKEIIKENKMMFVCLTALCLFGIAEQTFMSYLISFITVTLGITDYILPLGIVIIISAAITVITGVMFNKFGRKHFYIPLTVVVAAGIFLIYAMKFMDKSAYMGMLIGAGTLMLGGVLSLFGGLTATFQDYIPKGAEGRFQGVRMCFMVLVPMIIGPVISMILGMSATENTEITAPPFEIFLIAGIIVLLALVPLYFIRKDADNLREKLLKQVKNN